LLVFWLKLHNFSCEESMVFTVIPCVDYSWCSIQKKFQSIAGSKLSRDMYTPTVHYWQRTSIILWTMQCACIIDETKNFSLRNKQVFRSALKQYVATVLQLPGEKVHFVLILYQYCYFLCIPIIDVHQSFT